MANTVKTRFLILSDTHDLQFQDVNKLGGAFKRPSPRVDVVLHCGDITMRGGLPAYEAFLEMMGTIDAELKLVIAGNHDRDLDEKYWARLIQHMRPNEQLRNQSIAVKALMTGSIAKQAGVTYLEEGLSSFALTNGAKFSIYTSPYQPEFCDWAFPYERDEDRFNPSGHVAAGVKSIVQNPIPDFPNVDIIMTHGPPKGILDNVISSPERVGCDALLKAASRARPRLYCFGHIHEGYGCNVVEWKTEGQREGSDVVEGKEVLDNTYPVPVAPTFKYGNKTVMINAAIMNVHYRPTNAPWLVDIELPKSL